MVASDGVAPDARRCGHTRRGGQVLHVAANSAEFEVCQLLLTRTTLQLSGPAATNLNGHRPLDMSTAAFRHKVEKARVGFGAAIVHCGAPAAVQAAHGLQEALQRQLGRAVLVLSDGPPASVSADFARGLGGLLGMSPPNEAARVLRHSVGASDVLLLLLTRDLFTSSEALVAILTAVEMGKPVVGVPLVDDLDGGAHDGASGLGALDLAAAGALFAEQGEGLKNAAPGMFGQLELHGFNLHVRVTAPSASALCQRPLPAPSASALCQRPHLNSLGRPWSGLRWLSGLLITADCH